MAVLVVRLLEDYLVIPRVLGHAVGLSPLLVLVSVTVGDRPLRRLRGPARGPARGRLATLVDVIVRDRDPAEEEVPTVLFGTAKESEVAG